LKAQEARLEALLGRLSESFALMAPGSPVRKFPTEEVGLSGRLAIFRSRNPIPI
jgi:hypothetical protein